MFREVAPPLPDDGFSVRVLAALPAPSSSRTPVLRASAILAGAMAGLAFAWRPIAALWSSPPEVEPLRRLLAQLSGPLSDPHLLLAIALAAASLLYAFMDSRHRLNR